MLKDLFYKGSYGLERETLRVDSLGRMARTPHPFGESKNITRDFCENQIEIVTPVCKSVGELMESLKTLDGTVRAELGRRGENIWLYSNPPHFEDENDIIVANFTGEHSGKRAYREKLERRYGKRLMLFSGIHFNFSFDDEYLKTLYGGEDFESFKGKFYLRLYRQLCVHSWLPLLLTAASPICDRSLYADGERGAVLSEYASIRSGRQGYWNEFVPIVDTGSLHDFVASIKNYVDKGLLFSASELYLPVRIKPRGVNVHEALEKGVSHIELRMIDIDPQTPLGIEERDLEFMHLLIMYLSTLEDIDFTPEVQRQAVENHQNAALYDLSGVKIDGVDIISKAEGIIEDMAGFFELDKAACDVLKYEREKLHSRLCTRLRAEDIFGRG